MKLFQRIFFAAVLSGLGAGAVLSGIHQWRVAPLILEAEVYDNAEAAAAPLHDHGAAPAADASMAAVPEHEHTEEWKPSNGVERIGLTVLADLLAAVGFALVLAAVSVLTGIEVTAANGVIWGLCGFIVFHLAPAFGLPPELPGMPGADLGARQFWWWATVLATGAAFFGIAKFRNWPAVAIGAVLLLSPHVIGAPPPPNDPGAIPAPLATSFAVSALTASAAFWLILGPLYGWLHARFSEAPARAFKGAHA